MTTTTLTTTNPATTPPGDNVLKYGKVLGSETLKAIKAAELLFNKNDRLKAMLHAAIIAVGAKLQQGRDLHENDNIGFNAWVIRSKLNRGRIFSRQQERTAAMTIHRLVVVGEDVGEEAPLRLDLTECHRGRPGDIVEWAREHQPRLFKDLREPRPEQAAQPQPAAEPATAPLEDPRI